MITIPVTAKEQNIESHLRSVLPDPVTYDFPYFLVRFHMEDNSSLGSISQDRIYNGLFEKGRDEQTGRLVWRYAGYK